MLRLVFVHQPHESKPVEVFGQDESVISQLVLPTMSWVGPNQERGILFEVTRGGTHDIRILSRDSGFGMPISCEQLDIRNSLRQGTEYTHKAAATPFYSIVAKPPLKESPFVRSLRIDATKVDIGTAFI